MEYLEKGVACKYTAADSVKGLNQIFQHLLDSTPQHAPGWCAICFMVGDQLLKMHSPGGLQGQNKWTEGGSIASVCVLGCCTASLNSTLKHAPALAQATVPPLSLPPAAEVMERWGAVLARPHLQRYTEAATYYESAALKARSPLQAVLITNRWAWGWVGVGGGAAAAAVAAGFSCQHVGGIVLPSLMLLGCVAQLPSSRRLHKQWVS